MTNTNMEEREGDGTYKIKVVPPKVTFYRRWLISGGSFFNNLDILQNHDFLYNYFPIEDNCLYLSIEQDVMKEFIQLSKSKSNTMSFDEVVNGPGYRYGGQVKSTTHTRV